MATAKQQKTIAAPVTENAQETSATAIRANIATVHATGKQLEKLAHETALAILQHVETYGEVSLANKLVEALPDMSRRNSLKQWFMEYGKMTYSMKKKQLVFKKDFVTDIPGGTATPFWKLVKEEEFKPFDLTKKVESLLKAAENAEAEADERNKIDPTLLARLKAAIAPNI